jgi:hypothetical protein
MYQGAKQTVNSSAMKRLPSGKDELPLKIAKGTGLILTTDSGRECDVLVGAGRSSDVGIDRSQSSSRQDNVYGYGSFFLCDGRKHLSKVFLSSLVDFSEAVR